MLMWSPLSLMYELWFLFPPSIICIILNGIGEEHALTCEAAIILSIFSACQKTDVFAFTARKGITWYIWYKNIWSRNKILQHWPLICSFLFICSLCYFFLSSEAGSWHGVSISSAENINFHIIQAYVRQTAPRQPILVRFEMWETVR